MEAGGGGPSPTPARDRALNVFSRGFDPLAALRQPQSVPLPAPDARLYNNMGEWPLRGLGDNPYFDVRQELSIVKPKEDARREAIQQSIKTENTRRRELEGKEAAYLARGGLLGDIADANALLGKEGGGPMAGMAEWRQAGSRVCVSIRSTGKGRGAVRGRLTGPRPPTHPPLCPVRAQLHKARTALASLPRRTPTVVCARAGVLLSFDRHFNLLYAPTNCFARNPAQPRKFQCSQQTALLLFFSGWGMWKRFFRRGFQSLRGLGRGRGARWGRLRSPGGRGGCGSCLCAATSASCAS